MHCFYVDKSQIVKNEIRITGTDVNHIKNVLRMNCGEHLVICDGAGSFYECILEELKKDEILVSIEEELLETTELPGKLYLFQGLPKKDKMELIIQKSVELGVYEIIPVATKFCVVKIEDKKKEKKKLERWNEIAKAAAKQSGRGIIPEVKPVMSLKEAIAYAKTLSFNVIPYERAEGMKKAKEAVERAASLSSTGIFIGPEGGFAEEEIEMARAAGVEPISLGKRILRTETAGITILSLFMFEMESKE
ncbi:16S rRNA (uracil(1498)-N(3))-methyltransferase [Velocimicrobium porci]|uniref:Ribosomal RNA small subunit methyltransferase E n=1 Tax=Velocimicrobium porci TaxID=2606634 RepID=A0A6L5Y0E8_9FIRM|nr:16S rRNA (uracil(1498)-N(3))-methyltransferase [Velocimicrobium porci]MSS64414.1 16S rRNA (uracil(1498)-N(3))-methyltransferase [Velocimicrobium porci]